MKGDDNEFDSCGKRSHSKRLDIFNILKTGELTASEITKELGATKANASQHLALMRGILETRQAVGTNIYYRMTNDNLAEVCNLMQDARAYFSERSDIE